jgi:hypothetical protein
MINHQLAIEYRTATRTLNNLRQRRTELNTELLDLNNAISQAEAAQNKVREALLREATNE